MRNGSSKPHEHIPNGFDGEIFDPNKYAKKDSVFRVVYHGRFSRLYDVEACERFLSG